MDINHLLSNKSSRFQEDVSLLEDDLKKIITDSNFLVVGGAGSIGQAVTKEIFKRDPKVLHVVDINENNLVELVRDLRSSLGYINGEFKTFVLDAGSELFNHAMNNSGPYDYVLNLSALKHVRSEKDPYTLMRMITVNILNTLDTISVAKKMNSKKYFSVSSDKAANPVNMMGASKRIMEMFLMQESEYINISSARFANVAFSNGSLLDGFNYRIMKEQPITVPNNISRYFINLQESGELCLLSCLLGSNRDILFPKLDEYINLTRFTDLATKYLQTKGYEPFLCDSEEEARNRAKELILQHKWPCYFFDSDTTGEKEYEEFYTEDDILDEDTFKSIGVIKNHMNFSSEPLDHFLISVNELLSSGAWKKNDLVKLFKDLVPNFKHLETGKYLDEKM